MIALLPANICETTPYYWVTVGIDRERIDITIRIGIEM
jgi:hypothetical protein